MKEEQLVIMVQIRPIERMKGKAKRNRPILEHICKVLGRYKDVPTNKLSLILLKREFDHKIEVVSKSKPPFKASNNLNKKELLELMKQLNDMLSRN